ncbi:MAG: 30S ribosomal protein S20 [Planctomycetaceae bacterium]|nr:30S ribosomal protein S20 [Planctomycetaceae bacterium]
MAHSLSAKKRVRQNAVHRLRNRARKSMVKTQIKNLESALSAGDVNKAQEQFQSLTRKLDKIASTSTLHKNTASRIKSRMARRVNAMQSKVGG